MFHPGIFKAYDIRGIYPSELNEEHVFIIASSFAALLQQEHPEKKLTVVVGRDMRTSSESLAIQAIQALAEQGVDVVNIGLVSTPTFYFGVAFYGYDGGLMISASHNPKEYNGVKFTRAAAVPVSGDTGIYDIRDRSLAHERVSAKKHANPPVAVGQKGTISMRDGVLQDEVAFMLERFSPCSIKPLKIVADPANSMGSLYLEEVFQYLPCTLVKLNWPLDGTFPSHEPDPLKEENLFELKQAVIQNKADLGIATDGDGDRIFFVDEKGEVLPPAILRGMLAQIFLKEKPGAVIGYDIRPGRITRDMIEQAGGIPLQTRVGHSLIKEESRAAGAYFSGESSGHFFVDIGIGFFEVPVLILLKFLEELSSRNIPLSQWAAPYKKYFHSGEINLEVSQKDAALRTIEEKYKDAHMLHIDGVTIEYEDWWANIRSSNTQNLLRITVEARTEQLMKEKRDEILAFINS